MGWKSLGRDAVNRNTKPLQFEARIPDTVNISCAIEHSFYEEIKEYCESNQIKLSQLMRYAISKEMKSIA